MDKEQSKPLISGNKCKGPTDEKRHFHDVIFGLLFIGMFIGMVAISSIAFDRGDPSQLVPSDEWENSSEDSEYWFQNAVAEMKKDVGVLAGSLGLAVVLGFFWMQLIRTFTKLFIYLTLFAGLLLILAVGVVLFVAGDNKDNNTLKIVSYCVFGLSVLLFLGILFLRKKINLTAVLFAEACRGVTATPSVFIVSLIVVCIFSAFCVWWVAVFIYLYSVPEDQDEVVVDGRPEFDTSIRNLMYYQVFGFYWTSAFISGLFQVSVAGAISSWYFSRAVGRQHHGGAALKSFVRGLTYHFGSLAFGSLILAFVQFINFVLEQIKKANQQNKAVKCVICCIQCCLGCVKNMIQFVNRFAYIYIAVHGDSFCKSAKNCFELIDRNLFSIAVVDFFGDFVLFMGRLFGTAACVILTVGILQASDRDVSSLTLALVVVIPYLIFDLFSHIVGVSVDTVFVSYLIDLEENGENALFVDPKLHKLLQSKKKKHSDHN